MELKCLIKVLVEKDIIRHEESCKIVDNREYEILKGKINDFFKYDGCNWNSEEEYRYDELDYFLSTLHPLLDKCLNY